jgi:hypothetical protein
LSYLHLSLDNVVWWLQYKYERTPMCSFKLVFLIWPLYQISHNKAIIVPFLWLKYGIIVSKHTHEIVNSFFERYSVLDIQRVLYDVLKHVCKCSWKMYNDNMLFLTFFCLVAIKYKKHYYILFYSILTFTFRSPLKIYY